MTEDSTQPPVSEAAFALVDWGTTSFRLWLVDTSGVVLAESRGREGMMAASETGFEAVLARHLAEVAAPIGLPILICGMAGARQGWIEAPYVAIPAALDCLGQSAVRVLSDLGDVRILPGICQPDADAPEVMRGEETQLLGLGDATAASLVCMPGTHGKWVWIADGMVRGFATFLTGELFDVLGRHSVLKHAVGPDGRPAAPDEAFVAAMRRSLDAPQTAWRNIFGVRAAQLLGFAERGDGASQLSGLLIGAEVASALATIAEGASEVTLVASGPIAELYEVVLSACDLGVRRVDAEEATLAGLKRTARSIWPRTGE